MGKLFTTTAAYLLQPAAYKKYLFCLIAIAIVCTINYYSSFQFWVRNRPFWFLFIWYSLLFFFFLIVGLLIENGLRFLKEKRVQTILVFAPVCFALKVVTPFYLMLPDNMGQAYRNVFLKPVNWFGGVVITFIFLLVLHQLLEKKIALYGNVKTTSYRYYFLLIACMVPLLLWASLQADFAKVYPRAIVVEKQLGESATFFHYVFYELAYASDFFSIEFFFRGFLILALSKSMGSKSILPVALMYFSIHLGKPMWEAVSSFFGGLILGSIAYSSKSIWGGLLVHISIAMLMELFGYIF